MNILDTIVAQRRDDIARSGSDPEGAAPTVRNLPVTPFGRDPFLICEIKRRSPSKGDINSGMDAVSQAGKYREAGVRSVSILTESNYFGGSLQDLRVVKERYPDLSLLRKDFLLSPKDVEISHRAGADAVLLIVSILTEGELQEMYRCTKDLGMEALVEVHTPEDAAKAATVAPSLVGINSRDLTTFRVDLCNPVKMKRHISWGPRLVFESGIESRESARFALSSGFSGLLVGEAVVKRPSLIDELAECYTPPPEGSFWERLYTGGRKPLVKICGLTRPEDIARADDLGADIIGFILAPSPRQVTPAFIRSVPPARALRAGVVVLEKGEKLPGEITRLLQEGELDVIQFHGDEAPEECFDLAFPYYKALRLKDETDAAGISAYRCPRVLIDAYSSRARGGTGKQIDEKVVVKAAESAPLWLAGGIGPENIRLLVEKHAPELVDVSSGVESSPGIKNGDKLEALFREISHAG